MISFVWHYIAYIVLMCH